MAKQIKSIKDTTIRDEETANKKLLALSKDGNAWIYVVNHFGKETEFIAFKNRSSIPDYFKDLTRGKVALNGKIVGFTPSALKREEARRYQKNS